MRSVDAARAVYGQGLQGDRYASADGTFSRPGAAGHEVTLIETEALEALKREYDVALGPGEQSPERRHARDRAQSSRRGACSRSARSRCAE